MLLINDEGYDVYDYWGRKLYSSLIRIDQSDTNKEFHAWTTMWDTKMNRRCRAQGEAFTMGHHERLGAESRVRGLEPGVVKIILDASGHL